MKVSSAYQTLDLLLNSTSRLKADDFYALGASTSGAALQAKYSPSLVLAISHVAKALVKDDHTVTDWTQEVDQDTGFVYLLFKLNEVKVRVTLT